MIPNLTEILVVDFEATCWEPKSSRPDGAVSEVIEIGYCLVNAERGARSECGSIYVLPERSTISPFCAELTGITPEVLAKNNAVSYLRAVRELRARFPRLRDMAWGSWGDYDRELAEEMARLHADELPEADRTAETPRRKAEARRSHPPELYPFSRTHLNIKHFFALVSGSPMEPDLDTALSICAVPFEGARHRGADDAWNTAGVLGATLWRLRR